MANIRTVQRSFGAGEITPEMWGRFDDARYQTGLATCRNFITLPHGPTANRAGTTFVREVQDSTKKTRLIPFTYNSTQTMALEFCHETIRFHTQGATLLPGSPAAWLTATSYSVGSLVSESGANYYCITDHTSGTFATDLAANKWYAQPVTGEYEIATPYDQNHLMDIHYVQSADVLTLVHPSYEPRELRRLGATTWVLQTITFAADLAMPTSVVVTPGTGAKTNISAITKANPGVLTTVSDHGLVVGNTMYLTGVGGMVELTTGFYMVNTVPTTTSLSLKSVSGGVPVDTTAYTIYTTGGTVQLSSNSDEISNTYVVTAVGSNGLDQSEPSSPISATNNLFVSGSYNTISWAAVSGATRYNIFKSSSGLYGFIGTTEATSFKDDNITADVGITPPIVDAVFIGANNYPGSVSYFEQRRVFAATGLDPQTLWATRSGTESDISYSLPIKDDDRIKFRIAAREANTIRHIVPLGDMVLLTSGAEWRVTSINSDALTPTSASVKPQSYIGASNVQPLVVNNTVLYAAARGGHVRELAYNSDANGLVSGDVTLRCPHLFDQHTTVDMAFSKSPYPIGWFVRDDGKMLGFTYVPDQAVGSWHQHDTDGTFESVCCVAEGADDVLYLVVKRNINGNDVRYIERMGGRYFSAPEDAYFVDCGLTYDGAPADVIVGLDHLEGKTVSVLADGAVHPQCVVSSGQITLQVEASKVQIGLPIVGDLRTLPLAMMLKDGSMGQGRMKNVNHVFLRVHESSGIFAGPSLTELTEYKQRSTETYGDAPDLKSQELRMSVTPTWGDSGQVYIRQSDPLPLTIMSLSMEVAIGG